MEGVERQPHVLLSKADIHPVCIVVGDPSRTEQYARFCDEYRELAYNREYRSFSCTYKGHKFLIVSHGVGSAGASVCFRELIELGVRVILRAGTCGSLHADKWQQGDVLICYAAAKEDGVCKLLEPSEMPATADYGVTQILKEVAEASECRIGFGITLSSDLFYAPKVMTSTLGCWRDLGVDVVEMETAALFVLCRQHGVKCGCIVAVDGCPFGWKDGDYAPCGEVLASSKEKMGRIAIEAARRLSTEI